MKYIYFFISVMIIFPSTVFAEAIDIGKTKIQYNIPKGYIEANNDIDGSTIKYIAKHLPINLTLYKVYKSTILDFDDYIAIVYPTNVDFAFSKEYFTKYTQDIKNTMSKKVFDESARKAEKVLDIHIEPNEPIIINDEERLLSIITNLSYNSDKLDKYNLSMIISFIYCKNKLLAIYQCKAVHNIQDILKFIAIYKSIINEFQFR